jgi:acetyl-CoA C-acetyltransferase
VIRVTLDPRTPVVVGAGQFLQRVEGVEDALDAVGLMEQAIAGAAADAGLSGPPKVDSIRVVSLFSWRYRNPAWLVAEHLGLTPTELAYTSAGGNTPQSLVNKTALDLAAGRLDAAILVGGEAWRTRMRARRTGATLEWPTAPDDRPPVPIGGELDMSHPAETERGVYLPVQIYPMFETALRAVAGRPPEDHLVAISELWAGFSEVAAKNPFAWIRDVKSAEEIRTTTPDNRLVGLPYRKYMNSNNDVDMAAALIMCTADRARRLGIAADRWVFPQAGTDCHEHPYVSNRDSFTRTPAVEIGGRRVLELAGLGIDDIALIDLYSCFPSAVQLGARSLGLDLDGRDRPLTRTGGLSFAGGPWNNYVMHAIATVVGELREQRGDNALVWANGGYVTKHSFGVYAADPPGDGFRHDEPQAEIDALPSRALANPVDAAGPVTIEAYTVMHGRDGTPEQAIATGLLADGRRAWGLSADPATMAALGEGEWVGRPARVDAEVALLLEG